jgi:hypothetical protein
MYGTEFQKLLEAGAADRTDQIILGTAATPLFETASGGEVIDGQSDVVCPGPFGERDIHRTGKAPADRRAIVAQRLCLRSTREDEKLSGPEFVRRFLEGGLGEAVHELDRDLRARRF